jgi:hypothetical protein
MGSTLNRRAAFTKTLRVRMSAIPRALDRDRGAEGRPRTCVKDASPQRLAAQLPPNH